MKKHFPGFKKKTTSLEDLPQRGKMSPNCNFYPKLRSKTVWFHIGRTLKHSLNKPFDEVFSKFCKKFPKSYQSEFLNEFTSYGHFRNRCLRKINYYYVDLNGLIKYMGFSPDKKPKVFRSFDYKIETRHKYTGMKEPEGFKLISKKYKSEYYVPTIVSGYSLEFPSAKDRKFKRLHYEKSDKARKVRREMIKANKSKVYSFKDNPERDKNLEWTRNNIAKQNRILMLSHDEWIATSFKQ